MNGQICVSNNQSIKLNDDGLESNFILVNKSQSVSKDLLSLNPNASSINKEYLVIKRINDIKNTMIDHLLLKLTKKDYTEDIIVTSTTQRLKNKKICIIYYKPQKAYDVNTNLA